MPAYYFIYLIVVAGMLFLLVRLFIFGRKSSTSRLLADAIRAENNGDYLEAIAGYENALSELKKSRFQQRLKSKIIEKLKVLYTIKTYNRDQDFVRENNSWIN